MVHDESVFIQTRLETSQIVQINWTDSYGTLKPYINMWHLELSANFKGKVSGICGNYDGDPENDLIGPEENLISEEDSLFASCELIVPTTPNAENTKCYGTKYISDPCPCVKGQDADSVCGIDSTLNFVKPSMIYKRANQFQTFLEPLSSYALSKRQDGSEAQPLNMTVEAAKALCEATLEANWELIEIATLMADFPNPALLADFTEAIDSLVDGCASEGSILGPVGITAILESGLTAAIDNFRAMINRLDGTRNVPDPTDPDNAVDLDSRQSDTDLLTSFGGFSEEV